MWLDGLRRALRFRWVFPIGTMPVPYNPVVATALPWLPVALVGWSVFSTATGREGGVSPWSLFGPALALGLLLSVPLLDWALFVFRAPLLQGLFVTGGMAVVLLDALAGRLAPAWAALPAAYVALYVWQRLGGPFAVRRLHARNASAEPVDPGVAGVRVEPAGASNFAAWLVEHCDLARVRCGRTTWLRLEPAAYARVREVGEQVRTGFHARTHDAVSTEQDEPATGVLVTERLFRSWTGVVGGDRLVAWEVSDGVRRQRLVAGAATVVGPLPLFVLFHHTAVFGGRSRWVAGFPRRAAGRLGEGGGPGDRHPRETLFRVLPRLTDPPTHVVDAAAVLGSVEATLEQARGAYLDVLEELAALPELPADLPPIVHRATKDGHRPDREWSDVERSQRALLQRVDALDRVKGAALRGTGARLCDLLDRAKQDRRRRLAVTLARTLARVPVDELRALTPRLLRVTGSRILALEWRITPDLDVAPLPKGLPRFGQVAGFGLLEHAPELFLVLGELDDPRALTVVERLAEEAGWVYVLTRARDRYLERHPHARPPTPDEATG